MLSLSYCKALSQHVGLSEHVLYKTGFSSFCCFPSELFPSAFKESSEYTFGVCDSSCGFMADLQQGPFLGAAGEF